MTRIQLPKDFCRTMLISIAKLVVCICFYASFCFKCSIAYQVTQKDSKYNGVRTLNQFSSDNNQVKYPSFNKVMARIENLNDGVKTKNSFHKIRHKGGVKYLTTSTTTTTTTEADLFDTYGDLNEDDYFDSSYEDQEDEDDDFDYEDEDSSDGDTFDDTFDDIQNEEATEMPVTIGNSINRPMSSFSQQKWEQYGTMAKVEQSRNQQLNLRPSKEQLKIKAAMDHYARVSGQLKCLRPSPKVLPVQQEYPNPSKTYTPPCTVLHRCADDTGCCKRNTKCQYKSRELVHLYFYTSLLGTSETKVEKLAFYNHTECECKERTESTSAEDAKDVGYYKSANGYHDNTPTMNEERCKCPKRFLKIVTHKCTCDCAEENEDCLQLKKGKEHFSMTDRMCIQGGECTLPTCEYGSYIMTDGKCPTKKDKLEMYRRIKTNY